jgi:L-threonine-O-3-phosphate decarboxylase
MKTFGHGGNVRLLARLAGKAPGDILDFSANINPLGPPEWALSLVQSRFRDIEHYPDPDSASLTEAISVRYGVERENIIVGNGSTEILYLLPHVLPSGPVVIPVPAYVDYAHVFRVSRLPVTLVPLKEQMAFKPDMGDISASLPASGAIVLGQPNNPTGMLYDAPGLRLLARRHPSVLFIVDEAFGDFVESMDSMTHDRPSNVLVLLSLTKIFAIPGIRLGCAVADAEIVGRLKAVQPPWSVNVIAQMIGEGALKDREYVEKSRSLVAGQRRRLTERLRLMGCFTVYPGQANFLLLRIDRAGMDVSRIAEKLLAEGIAIRRCHNFAGLDDRFFRIAVRTETENERLLASLEKIVTERTR